MAYHLGHLEGGYLGVDLFFVLSGFLITSLLVREGTATGRVDLRRFWVRRARRLLPALGVALVGVVVAARIWLDHSTLPALRVDALATAGYVANWRFATQAVGGYFAADPSPLRHTWSLAIEEQYYLVWPLLVVAALVVARRRGAPSARLVGLIAAAGAVASSVWMVVHAGAWSTDRLYLGTDTRLVAPLTGAVLACLLHGRLDRRPSPRVRQAATVVGSIALVGLALAVALVPASSGWMYRGGFALMALLGGAVVGGGVLGGDGMLARALGPAPLRWVGERSYGLYLYSWPIQIVLRAEGADGITLAATTVAASFAVAAVSYRVLEMPIRRGGLRAVVPGGRAPARATAAPANPRRRAPAALVAVSVVAVVGVVVAATTTAARPDPLAALDQDELQQGASRPAVAGSPGGADGEGSRVLVVGDSVGYTVGRFAPASIPGVASVDSRSLPGCGLLTEGDRPAAAVAAGSPEDYEGCAMPVADADRLGLDGDPDVVLLVTGAWESSEHERHGRTVGPGDPGWTTMTRELLDARVTDLSADGAVVALWADPCGPDEATRSRQRWFTEEVLHPIDAARDEAVVIRPEEITCDEDRARTDVPEVGDPRPEDGQHWSEEGARWLWQQWLGPTLHDLDGSDTGDGGSGPAAAGPPAADPTPIRPVSRVPPGLLEPTRVVVAGDSVAFTLVYDGAPGAREAGIALRRSPATIGCGVLREGTTVTGSRPLAESCGPTSALEVASLAADPDVVLAQWGAWEMSGVAGVPSAGQGRPGDPAYDAYVRLRLADRLLALGAGGAAVVLLGVDCWPTVERRGADELGWWRALSRDVADQVGAIYLDPSGLLCRDGRARTDLPGVGNPRPGDGAHWSGAGASWFWRTWLGPALHFIAGKVG